MRVRVGLGSDVFGQHSTGKKKTAQLLSSIQWDWLWCLMCVPLEMKIHCFNKSSTDRREKSVPLERSVSGKADCEGLMVF